ncbi:unnamed protein product [Rodentolepis nana]|uniref:BZIP domain-containing protein n=1 Tax=Rodentolepis nana TaxID=102285 RepID=A0A0R3TPY3_RODNA|nr:unnamed protein product [Rodentolepis nana]
MTESSHLRANEDDSSCDSDSAETVVLGDDLGFDRCNKGISFLRFMSVEDDRDASGDLLLSKCVSKPRLSDLPTGLSILKNHVNFTESSLPPGSFSFKECRIKMDMDSQHKRLVEHSSPDSTTHSPNVDSEALPNHILSPVLDPIVIPINSSLPQIAPLSEGSSSDGQFKQPRSIPISELRCKNREAARKSRAKKKNYIQQLEHDFKELKEKYASMQQENADLRRFIFQHFGVNLSSPKPESGGKSLIAKPSSNQPSSTVKQIAPAPPVLIESNGSISSSTTAPPISVMLEGTSGVQVLPVAGALGHPIILKVVQPDAVYPQPPAPTTDSA